MTEDVEAIQQINQTINEKVGNLKNARRLQREEENNLEFFEFLARERANEIQLLQHTINDNKKPKPKEPLSLKVQSTKVINSKEKSLDVL